MPIARPGAFSLQTKIILLVILIVCTVLSFSTYLRIRVSEKILEEDVKERAILVARGLAVGIRSQRGLGDVEVLQGEIQSVVRARGAFVRIGIFGVRPHGLVLVASSEEDMAPTLYERGREAIKEKRTVAVLRGVGRKRVWDVAVPIRIGRRIVGAVAVEASLERADRLAARERRQSFAIGAAAAILIVGILSWYLQRAVNRPIQALVDTMAKAKGGDLEVQVEVKRHDELGRLAGSFNRMLQRIANFNQELRLKIEQATGKLAERNEELKKLNERLFNLQRELTRANRLAAVGQLTAMVAHEIGTPLHSISGHVQILLQEEQGNEKTLYRLRIIEAQIARVVEILEHLLTAAHPRERAFEPVDINALLEELFDLTGPAIDQKGVKVSLDLDPSLPGVRGERGQLQQVFLNLILNALEAMPNGGQLAITTQSFQRSLSDVQASKPEVEGVLRISPFEEPSDVRLVEITVSDTGEGIPPEHLSRIFEPFFTTKEAGQGTGLGLTICQRLVKAYGGTITVTSEVGQGSTFTIHLPADKGNDR